ncbi:MAG: hypothetical protein AAFU33_24715 [Bacteroidota bacterium]
MEKILNEMLQVDYEALGEQLAYAPRLLGNLFYKMPLGLPIHYSRISPTEETVMSYYLGDKLSEEQIRIMREFLIYYLHAPCWTNLSKMSHQLNPKSGYAETIIVKRRKAFELDTVDKLTLFLVNLQDLALDPF